VKCLLFSINVGLISIKTKLLECVSPVTLRTLTQPGIIMNEFQLVRQEAQTKTGFVFVQA